MSKNAEKSPSSHVHDLNCGVLIGPCPFCGAFVKLEDLTPSTKPGPLASVRCSDCRGQHGPFRISFQAEMEAAVKQVAGHARSVVEAMMESGIRPMIARAVGEVVRRLAERSFSAEELAAEPSGFVERLADKVVVELTGERPS